MEDNDGNKGNKVAICPFMNEQCIGDTCALNIKLARSAGGILQKYSSCAFPALVQMIGEINAKTQPPQQKIQLPNILRGG